MIRRDYQRNYMRLWRAKNPEKVKESNARRRNKPGARDAAVAAMRRWRHAHPEHREKSRIAVLERTRKMTMDDFLAKAQQQEYRCMICRVSLEFRLIRRCPNKACLDHDHGTGQNRDILCSRCNTAFGLFRENETILLSAVEYSRKWGTSGSRSGESA